MKGYNGILLHVDLSSGKVTKRRIPDQYYHDYIGGRGLGMRYLWDFLPGPGVDPLSPGNPLLFMPGLLTGFPVPSSSRTVVVCKSPRTSPLNPEYEHSSGISYANMGGFVGPELRFAGYDGLMVTGASPSPVFIHIDDDKVEIRDATKYWGMGTDAFDKAIIRDLGDRRFESCYIGPAGEKMVRYACVLNTAARSAGRGGTGCVMGSKKLKAVVVKGSGMPAVADHAQYLELLDKARQAFAEDNSNRQFWRGGGTTNALTISSERGTQAVRNYREGTFEEIEKIGTIASRDQIWKRDFACFSCALACKKSGYAKGAYGGPVHDGPEYETGTMLGANLLISDLAGLQKCIFEADDLGIDIISLGNVIGFLMEAREKELIDDSFTDGIHMQFGDVDATLAMIRKIGERDGIGELASIGVRALAEKIGQGSSDFAIHVKGHELAAWNVHKRPDRYGISYTTSNRGACHLNGGDPKSQDGMALKDSLGACTFASGWYKGDLEYRHFMKAISGQEWTEEDYDKAGERIYNLERMINIREGFSRADDVLPRRFFKDAYTLGPAAGSIVDEKEFKSMLDEYYKSRAWDIDTGIPTNGKLQELGLGFMLE